MARSSVRVSPFLHCAAIEPLAADARARFEDASPLLSLEEAYREAEEHLSQFDILYPNESLVRTALRGAAADRLSWFDAHLWAHGEHFGLDTLISEDFQHGRLYGSVRVENPFLQAGAA